MTVQDVHQHMQAIAPWVDWETSTCDGLKFGDPDTEVGAVAVGWMCTMEALRRARERGCNLFIAHEPTFYSHMDDDERLKHSPPGSEKAALLAAAGMAVYRSHDAWDLFPGIGVLDSWAQGLGLTGTPVATDRYYAVYQVPGVALIDLADEVAHRTRPLGQNAVAYAGDPDQTVNRLAIGTGAITDIRKMVDLGADCCLTTDDGLCGWSQTSWLLDAGLCAIRVNHCVAEEWGMANLADYLRRTFRPVEVHYIRIGSLYRYTW